MAGRKGSRMHTREELRMRQALPLNLKIRLTEERIREWINHYGIDGVYISFSGGKDSTVLLDIARRNYPNIKAAFADIPTQYPELRQFVKTFENVDIVKPKIGFIEVCEKYGFPLFSKEISECVNSARKYLTNIADMRLALTDRQTDRQIAGAYAFADLLGIERRAADSKQTYQDLKNGIIPSEAFENAPVRVQQLFGKVRHKKNGKMTSEYSKMFDKSQYQFMLDAPFEISNACCKVMKKAPMHKYSRETGRAPITAQMAEESKLRESQWIKRGCNSFDSSSPISNPMSFWTEQDVLLYIKEYLEPPLADAWKNIYNPIRKKRKKARRALRRFGYRKTAICSVYGQVVSDDEEMGQMQLSDYGFTEFDRGQQALHCTGCDRTGCVLCGFGAHIQGNDRFVKLKETHPGLYGLLDVVKNNGYTMRQAIDWIAEHSDKVIKY